MEADEGFVKSIAYVSDELEAPSRGVSFPEELPGRSLPSLDDNSQELHTCKISFHIAKMINSTENDSMKKPAFNCNQIAKKVLVRSLWNSVTTVKLISK